MLHARVLARPSFARGLSSTKLRRLEQQVDRTPAPNLTFSSYSPLSLSFPYDDLTQGRRLV